MTATAALRAVSNRAERREAARKGLTIDELRERIVVSIEECAAVFGIGRSAAYECARRGEIPTVRLGARLVVPVPALLKMLGAELDEVGGDV